MVVANIQHPLLSHVTRDNDYPEPAKELGRFHEQELAAHKEEAASDTRKLNRIRKQAAILGAPVNGRVRNPDRVSEGQAAEQEALELLKQKGITL
jgi:hypothetical protein